ncbi:tRNA modification GTPase TrmE [Cystobasidium minutum MCA 4210]|uniref:tRNA modification GTPase TrmE n=1 Tax=Cystobasidium minutum MCA 4210 TaxID=1397322 RepID=UPI0034CF916E|eukprot:jgi/Rhomi1/185568/estExt_fgenesh1_pm.C_30192
MIWSAYNINLFASARTQQAVFRQCRRSFSRSIIHLEGSKPEFRQYRTPTIYAPATPPGKSAIAVVRIAGPQVSKVWQATRSPRNGKHKPWPPPARKAVLRDIYDAATQQKLDQGLVIYFPAESSLTALEMLELHLHGSTAVMKAVLRSLSTYEGFRPADPGEFTKLAFENGRMDLTEVEGLRDLIESETEAQRKLAVLQAGGEMRKAYDSMRKDIISAMSVAEAMIDFGEDEQIEQSTFAIAVGRIHQLRDKIVEHLNKARRAEVVRNGIRLAIFGAPNAGKSSFLNWLSQREASIVTAHPGTTRDIVEVSLDFHGYPVIVSDTAGLRDTSDEVESIGVQRAKAAVVSADVKICMISVVEMLKLPKETAIDPMSASLVDEDTLFVLNKTDLVPVTPELRQRVANALGLDVESDRLLFASIEARTGLDELSGRLQRLVEERFDVGTSTDMLLVTRERHRFHLEECLQCLNAFLSIDPQEDLVGAAEELRYAAQALGKVTGQVQVDEILDELFSSFCIGK